MATVSRFCILASIATFSLIALFIPFAASSPTDPAAVRVSVIPPPDIDVVVAMAQDGRTLTYTITLENVGEGVAKTVNLRVALPEGTTYNGDPQDLVNGVWTRTYEDLAPGSYSETIEVEVADTAADGDPVLVIATVDYVGYSSPWFAETYWHESYLSFPVAPTPAFPLMFVAPPAIVGAAAAFGFGLHRVRKGPRFEQVYLMHNSGMLIHHWAANGAFSHDTDIMSGMFVILKEFVRDSFRDSSGRLQELQFGDSRVFLAESPHALLAAVVRGKRANGVPAQVEAAVRDFEQRYGKELSRWTGRTSRLPQAESVVKGLVGGQYAHRRAS